MPSLIELPATSTPADADQTVINQGASATGDRRITLADFFTWVTGTVRTFTAGIAIGSAALRLYRPAAGVLRQRVESTSLATLSGLTVASDSTYCVVTVFSVTWGLFAEFIVEGATRTLVRGSATYFATTETAGKICCLTSGGLTYIYNGTAAAHSLSVRVWG